MCSTSVGDCAGRYGTALTCLISWLDMMASSCSQKMRRGLLGTTRSPCMIQKDVSGGGGILVVHWVTEGSLCAEAARRSAVSLPATPECLRIHTTDTGACRGCSQLRRWSHKKASGELISSRDIVEVV